MSTLLHLGYALLKNPRADMRSVSKCGGLVGCASYSDQVRKMSGNSIPCG